MLPTAIIPKAAPTLNATFEVKTSSTHPYLQELQKVIHGTSSEPLTTSIQPGILPSVFHELSNNSPQSRIKYETQKQQLTDKLGKDQSSTSLKAGLALTLLNLAVKTIPAEQNNDLVAAKSYKEQIAAQSYFDYYNPLIDANIQQYELGDRCLHKLITPSEQIKRIEKILLSLKRTLWMNVNCKAAQTFQKNIFSVLQRSQANLAGLTDDQKHQLTNMEAWLEKQDPFKGEQIPENQLSKAPTELVQKSPYLQKLVKQHQDGSFILHIDNKYFISETMAKESQTNGIRKYAEKMGLSTIHTIKDHEYNDLMQKYKELSSNESTVAQIINHLKVLIPVNS